MRRVDPDYRRVLGLGIMLLVAATLLFLYLADVADAHAQAPPTRLQAQRILGRAFDARLRPIYPRSGITTRCRGTAHYLLCSVHVWRRGEHLFFQLLEVRLENGAARTALSTTLVGQVRIPGRSVSYRTRAMS